MILLFVASVSLTIHFVSMSDSVLDSSSNIDLSGKFRSSACFSTLQDQMDRFYAMTSTPEYKNWQRPGLNANGSSSAPLQVNVSLDMNSLTSVDDINSEYSLIFIMDLEWLDNRLAFDCKRETVMMSMDPWYLDRLWYPKLGVPNVKEPGSIELNGEATKVILRIRTDGYIFLRLRFKLKLFCQLNFKRYPFDNQNCYVKLESRSLSDDQLVLSWHEVNPFRNSDSFHMTGFRLIDYELFNDSVQIIDMFETDRVSRIKVLLHLQREWYHYLLDVYLPTALFVMISWLSFWLEISAAPARVTLGMTTMLTLVTTSIASREKLPKVSYIHALDIWIAFCICFVFASLIEFAIVSFIYRRERNRQQKVKSLQRDLSALSLASLASSTDPMITVSTYLDVPEKPKLNLIDCDLSTDYLTVGHLADNLRRLSQQTIQTSGVPKKCPKKNWASNFGLRKRFRINNSQELADEIDRKCRLLFPLCFSLFNIIYWTSV